MPLRRHYRSLLLALCLCTLLLSPAAFAPRHAAQALSSPITVSSRTYSVRFPDYIDLSVSASDPIGMIVRASLDIYLSDNSPQEIHSVPIGKVGHTISTTWHENTSGSNFVPPGSLVSYSWQFWDSAGNTLTDTRQQFATTDTRFTWQHLSQGLLQVNWYNRPLDFGRVMLEQASDRITHISSVLGGGLLHPINLWVYETIADFHGSLSPGSYEWVGGVAFPMLREASIVAASTSDYTLVRDMPHELTHLIFHQLTDNRIDIPTWFDEGLAVYNQIYHEPDMSLRFQKALRAQALLRLDDISSGFPANTDQAYLAYAQSWNLVDYMYSTFGQPRMAKLIKDLGNTLTDVNGDFQQALGVDELHLENQWRLHLHQPWVIPPAELTPVPHPVKQNATTDTSSWLLLGLGVLLVVGALSTLLVLVLFSVRRNRAAAAKASLQQGNQAISYPYPDPSTYMRTSMYASPTPSTVQSQEYPANPPGKQTPQE